MRKGMDLVSICKSQLAYFRVKELKDVLSQLGLAKQGRKQDLLDRILAFLSDEEISKTQGTVKIKIIGKEVVAKIIDETYRTIQASEATELVTMGQSILDTSSVQPKKGDEKSFVRCPCGSSLPNVSMIQCVDPNCRVQQHIGCVIVSAKPAEDIQQDPSRFHCEMCRIKHADPFWVTLTNLVSPVKLIASTIPSDGNPVQNMEKTFQFTRADRKLYYNTEYDVQAWCILLDDTVSFRMQWPLYADLQVNGNQVRIVNRGGSQLLGANGRDDGALITSYIREGINKISLSFSDARIFCFGVRLVQRRTIRQVLDLIRKETNGGELFEDALARVRRCFGGGVAMETEDSDSDLEVIADSITVNLRCPVSGSRMKIAGRFKPCTHMGCFDLETFVALNKRSRKWQCPICLKNYSLADIIIDPYFNRITTMMLHCGEDITEVDLKADGSWCVKTKGQISNLVGWHYPDGSPHFSKVEVFSNLELSSQVKQEGSFEGHSDLRLGIEKNLCVVAEANKHQFVTRPSLNQLDKEFANYGQNVKTMSSSATGNGRDDEDPSINQDCSGHINNSINNANEINYVPHNFQTVNGSFPPLGDADIILVSDSEEETINLVSPEIIYRTCPVNDSGCSLSPPPGVPNAYLEDLAVNSTASPGLGFLNGSGNDIGISEWPYPSSIEAGLDFQMFGTDSDMADAFIDLEHTLDTSSALMNGYTSASKSTLYSAGQVLDCSVSRLDGNPLAFVGENPSLQNLLPTQPADVSTQPDLEHRPPVSNGVHCTDWISLGLGSDGESAANVGLHAATTNGLDLRNRCGSNEAALLKGMDDEARCNKKTERKMSNGPFSFPRQPRSFRYRGSKRFPLVNLRFQPR